MEISKKSFSEILDNLHEGLYAVDRNRTITYWNKSAELISGFSAAEVLGRTCSDNILTHVDEKGNSLCLGKCPLAYTMEDGKPRESKVFLHHKDGHRVQVAVKVNPVTDGAGNLIGGVELFVESGHHRIPESKIRELEKMAMLDNLTELPNRNYLDRELGRKLEETKLYNLTFGFLFMDVDHFKKFNDTYGHEVGDQVLKFVGKTLSASTRASDVFGRWGGEEFVGVLSDVNRDNLEVMGNRLRMLVESSYIIHNNKKLSVTISVGASLSRYDDTLESLMRRADTLMYASKQAGRNRLTLG